MFPRAAKAYANPQSARVSHLHTRAGNADFIVLSECSISANALCDPEQKQPFSAMQITVLCTAHRDGSIIFKAGET
jgi:hypothetical protein